MLTEVDGERYNVVTGGLFFNHSDIFNYLMSSLDIWL